MAKDTFFCPKKTLNCGGKLVELSTPQAMGILNATPDSFYDGGKTLSPAQACLQAGKMLEEGAGFLDLGAASSRPGADLLPQTEERERLEPVLKAIVKAFPEAILSVDTYYAETARFAVGEGAHIVNDISAGSIDPDMFPTIASLKVPYVLMHMQGTPLSMQQRPVYKDVVMDISRFFNEKISRLNELGVADILIDPGFGFGKTLEHSYQLLYDMDFLAMFERPVLVGLSRKSLINKVLDIPAREALNGTTVVHTLALLKGADILRVHDVKAAMEAIAITNRFMTAKL
jgi:dihydropteroate synthase